MCILLPNGLMMAIVVVLHLKLQSLFIMMIIIAVRRAPCLQPVVPEAQRLMRPGGAAACVEPRNVHTNVEDTRWR